MQAHLGGISVFIMLRNRTPFLRADIRALGGALEGLYLRTYEPWGRFFFCAGRADAEKKKWK